MFFHGFPILFNDFQDQQASLGSLNLPRGRFNNLGEAGFGKISNMKTWFVMLFNDFPWFPNLIEILLCAFAYICLLSFAFACICLNFPMFSNTSQRFQMLSRSASLPICVLSLAFSMFSITFQCFSISASLPICRLSLAFPMFSNTFQCFSRSTSLPGVIKPPPQKKSFQ